MQKIINKKLGMILVGAALVSVQNANANGAGGAQGSDYLVQVQLSHQTGRRGNLKIYKLENGTPVYTGQGCSVIGGNAAAWPARTAVDTPAGTFRVFNHTNPLIYNGAPDEGYNYASYFKKIVGSQNQIAIHTAPSYNQNSHGCVRAPCAKDVYDLPGTVSVQVEYVD